MAEAKRIGVLTSGGDCAGLNAAIRAVAYRAIEGYGFRVFGIHHGTHGLMETPVAAEELTLEQFDGNILRMGGTILGSMNRGDPFAFPMPDGTVKDRSEEIIDGYRELGLDALIGIGGDGSLAIMRRLALPIRCASTARPSPRSKMYLLRCQSIDTAIRGQGSGVSQGSGRIQNRMMVNLSPSAQSFETKHGQDTD